MYRKADIIDHREMLRVKVKSLAEEARIIRAEERKTHGPIRELLHLHRVGTVRFHARHATLALGFIKGRTLAQMEPSGSKPIHWPDIKRMLKDYGAPKMLPLLNEIAKTEEAITKYQESVKAEREAEREAVAA